MLYEYLRMEVFNVLRLIDFIAFPLSFVFNNFVSNKLLSLKNRINYYNFKRKVKKIGIRGYIGSNNLFSGLKNVYIGDDFYAGDNLFMATYEKYANNSFNPKIIIGNNVRVARNVHIGCINEIHIEDNELIGSNVLITDHSHGNSKILNVPIVDQNLYSKGKIVIGFNSWICDNCVILGNVHIGSNCIVAANSVINKSFPSGCIIAGCPAKIVKYLE